MDRRGKIIMITWTKGARNKKRRRKEGGKCTTHVKERWEGV